MAQGVGGRLGLVSGVNHWLLYDTNNNIAVYGGSDGVVALVDTTLKLLNRQQTGNGAASADERRAKQENNIRSRASLVINVFAFFLAVNTWYTGHLSNIVLNNTIVASDVWAFYQAKSIKQTQYEIASAHEHDPALKKRYDDTIARYESDPNSGEGKRELMAKARTLEADRDVAKRRAPWIGYAGTAYQLAIVLLSASILSLNPAMFWGSFAVAGAGLVLSLQGVMLLF